MEPVPIQYETEENKNPDVTSKLSLLIDFLEEEREKRLDKPSSISLPRITNFKNHLILLSSFIWKDDWEAAWFQVYNRNFCFRNLKWCFFKKRKLNKEKVLKLHQEAMSNVYHYIQNKIDEKNL